MNLTDLSLYVVWLVSEILINRLTRSKTANADANSLRLIWLTVIVCVTLAVFASMYVALPIVSGSWLYSIGTIMMIFGIVARIIVVFSLGRMFTADVTIRQDHALKTDGFYRYVRHPSYTFSLMTFWGFAVSLNNWLSALLIIIPITVAFSYRVRIEENALRTYFGKAYEDYRSRTKRFIPFVY